MDAQTGAVRVFIDLAAVFTQKFEHHTELCGPLDTRFAPEGVPVLRWYQCWAIDNGHNAAVRYVVAVNLQILSVQDRALRVEYHLTEMLNKFFNI